ncbi:50S ribosomal protein L24 [Siphonobacter aquaeclarae]|jgi:large subunit ribosomal protein L24|uniref:Large ribosomal subunit protein uL24 n=1 Tax=Siphonobacter aquaeclarae TaxID=563176 RepID=A0A1G9N3W0_9BACT|nr:50S ribosomal protein L24 [Siphonobacter aquaeclarae]MBO9639503.1 50S ribosomal protein L24 [Siphonobacter aquaeclarae]SDL81256.1 LSU ribosomal protein L24P [Siphonobacter aquaeclarae]
MANQQQVKLHVRSGDTVEVIAGDAKGKKGVVKSVDREKQRAIVEGVNFVKKHVKPSATNPQGEIKEIESPIHLSNLKVVDPKSGVASRTGRKLNEKGKSQRYSKKSGNFI